MIYIALATSIIAFISGMLAVGTGRDWRFTNHDIMLGRDNAIAYIWVTISTFFCMSHASVIGFWIAIGGTHLLPARDNTLWFTFHAIMGVLFFTAHMFIKSRLVRTRNEPDTYLWGDR